MPWDQILILLTGPTAIGLSQIRATERYACIVGCLGQCGWFHATWIAGQTGMFLASFVYAGMWLLGLYRHWIRPWWSSLSELDTATTPLVSLSGHPVSPKARGGASNNRHHLRLVK